MMVLFPSRNRPQRAYTAVHSAIDTATGEFEYRVLVDHDDPTLPEYEALGLDVMPVAPGGYVVALNQAAKAFMDTEDILGAYQDDVIFRTPGWDARVRETLATPGIAYGDDLIHGVNHPTAVFVSTVIIRALGWLALPTTWHQWADDCWKALGQATGCLRFMDGVIFEHIHPAAGKAPMDEGYERVFGANEGATQRAASDYYAFHQWLEDRLDIDAAKVRAVL